MFQLLGLSRLRLANLNGIGDKKQGLTICSSANNLSVEPVRLTHRDGQIGCLKDRGEDEPKTTIRRYSASKQDTPASGLSSLKFQEYPPSGNSPKRIYPRSAPANFSVCLALISSISAWVSAWRQSMTI